MSSVQLKVAKELVSKFQFYLSISRSNEITGPYGDYLYILNFHDNDNLEAASHGATLFNMAQIFETKGYSFTYHVSGEDGYEPIGITDQEYHGDIIISLTRN